MSHKQILFHSAAREKVLRGAAALADAVRVTLGPKLAFGVALVRVGAPSEAELKSRKEAFEDAKRMRTGTGNRGLDASKGTYVDLVDEAGIVDPTKVIRVALENAVSVASVLLLTEATMTEIPEPPTKAEAAPGFE